ncbi:MAG TPA: methyltransferase [Polyangiaceae bacterium]|jgi:tRNA1(Val) A37 N6-methylase TrmN6|nr:methyltransferase [Polyangiaceae bacterium]
MAGAPTNDSGSASRPDATTKDTLYAGAVHLRQPANGYRVNVDALLLAAFAARGRRADLAVDLGSGVGSVALGLHHLGAAARFALVEREALLLGLAEENARSARMSSQTFACDLNLGLPDALRQAADLVVSNPPFFDPDNSRPSVEPDKKRARFGALGPFVVAAAAALQGTRSRAAFVYPARELSHFLACAEAVKLIPKRLRLVHSDASSPARVALIELRRAKPGGLVILPPLFEWAEKGVRSPELARILAGELPEDARNERQAKKPFRGPPAG